MSSIASFVGGLAGAAAVTAVNETVRQFVPQAPQLQLLGIQAVRKLFIKSDADLPDRDTQYGIAMGGELMANASYYSLAGRSTGRGLLLGLAAGLGGIFLPDKMGLSDAPTNRTTTAQILTIGYYVLGGIVAAKVTRALS
ncbi:hypothetical protein [Cesiribacter andamanensis]|uniref:Uncharacterized protein n=1 Tax=Cesiribacter andamanensis AMV16 TaxID=1279009 RepID=M7NAS6_9BACT|nr:hypothetical protein [Cesiribacter andamanensis]EMR04367.1 hypothetical protein ADICEAN_00530 [Cesiribacter andamanensis AMV16]